MIAKVILVGRVERQKFIATRTGGWMISLSVVTEKEFKKQDGSQGMSKMFHDVTVYTKQPEMFYINQGLSPGAMVAVDGELTNRSWKDGAGATHWVKDIKAFDVTVLTPFKGAYNQEQVSDVPHWTPPVQEPLAPSTLFTNRVIEEDLPF